MDAAVDIGSNPVSKHQIQPECGEWAGRHETGRPNRSRKTKFSGVNGDKEIFPCSADHVNRIGSLPVDLYSAIYSDNNKTCQYSSSSSTSILYLNILYIVVGVGKIYGCRRGHREQSRE